jgi:cytochrome b pre-mRNA-processing protein 3
MFNALRRRAERKRLAGALLEGLVVRARAPAFFADFAVPDTIDGRFDVLALHAWAVLDRLAELQADGLSQALVDALFVQFDEALREQGAGDIGMARRMNRMADAFYGRLEAYGEATDRAALAAAIVRNVFRGAPERIEQGLALAIYVDGVRARLRNADLSSGALEFGPLPMRVHERS